MPNKYLIIGGCAVLQLIVTANVYAQPNQTTTCAPINEQQVAALFDRWNHSLATKDPDQVVANYADNAVLLATLANKPRINHEQIEEYFEDFLKKAPQGTINDRVIRIGCNWASDTGVYTFTLKPENTSSEHEDEDEGQGIADDINQQQQVQARYSFLYEYINGKWLIVHHHSSLMPHKDEF